MGCCVQLHRSESAVAATALPAHSTWPVRGALPQLLSAAEIPFGNGRLAKYDLAVSATEIISQIKKLPAPQRTKGFRFVDEALRRAEDLADNAAADRAIAEPGQNIPWSEARKKLGWA